MAESVIQCEGIGKRYRLGERESYRALRDSITNAFRAPFQKLNGKRQRTEMFWALRDISFQVKQGEVLGVVGRNGAGKSTLLKILSRITKPTVGRATIRGRVGSLLEVGTGFHPELTGRENIYLNGAILGMKKSDIDKRFDEIVSFAEIEKFVDTPVKRFSSGMYVRLAFAVAAHLEPDILLIDEVLAVGDAVFQNKCLGKMSDVTREGRTILFVSHNMGAVRRLCHSGLFLDGGRLLAHGPIDSIIDLYSEHHVQNNAEVIYPADEDKVIQILRARLIDHTGAFSTALDRMQPFSVAVDYMVKQKVVGAHVGIMLDKADGLPICHPADNDARPDQVITREPGVYRSTVEFPGALLNAGAYRIRIGIASYSGSVYDYREPFDFALVDEGTFASVGGASGQRAGILAPQLNWRTELLPEKPESIHAKSEAQITSE